MSFSLNPKAKSLKSAFAATLLAAALALTGCATATPTETASPSESETALATLTPGKLTIGTGLPAYEPWVVGDAPESGEGFEAAVAYAVAEQLGFAAEDVVWVRTTFDEAIAPGAKNFDFNLQQYSITDERKAAVDFSSPYYETTQTIITVEGSKAAGATTIFVSELNPNRRALAKKLVPEAIVFDPRETDTAALFRQHTELSPNQYRQQFQQAA